MKLRGGFTGGFLKRGFIAGYGVLLLFLAGATNGFAVPLPGGTLDPLTIPKYVTPLVIPPAMPASTVQPAPGGLMADYNIAVRQFKQQILPAGMPSTPIWSYGLEEDMPAFDPSTGNSTFTAPVPVGSPGATFNYPALTVENVSGTPTTVRWINDLKNPVSGAFLSHLLPGAVDQTLHWANPPATGCLDGGNHTECKTSNPLPYTGPVPIVTHVHGSHVNAESDGYPEAWWLPAASNIPAGYATTGALYTQRNGSMVQDYLNPIDFDPVPGAAFYTYENSQPATTLWYHDHTLGMTRLNVYAGPAGFWLLRGGAKDGGVDQFKQIPAVLPGPAPTVAAGLIPNDPNFDPAYRKTIREIPIAIQDRSFNSDGSLFYPDNRAFFDTFPGPYVGTGNSDISPIWNPEAFFNTMVVNGSTWPQLDVAPARYRLRLLNGCNSRFLNLSMFTVDPLTGLTTPVELPFYQIGGDQGFLPNVVEVRTGFLTPVNSAVVLKLAQQNAKKTAQINAEIAKLEAKKVGASAKKIAQINAEIAKLQLKITQETAKLAAKLKSAVAKPLPAPDPAQALLMTPAERADVIVDFSALPNGTIIRMINTADDAPFGGFAGAALADPATTGQVMQFVVNNAMRVAADATTTLPLALKMNAEIYNPAAPNPATGAPTTVVAAPRQLSLNEEESALVCVDIDAATGNLFTVGTLPEPSANPAADCAVLDPNFPMAVPQMPKAALLGGVTTTGGVSLTVPKMWSMAITETPALNSSEFWDFYNFTVDGHPIHMHLVRFKVIQRQLFDPLSPTFAPLGTPIRALPTEAGMKDTVLAYPGEITRVQATFDLPGLYVWHCHIVEHEDNEMMRPYYVGTKPVGFPVP